MPRKNNERTKRDKILFTWSGGKDSALALHALRKDHAFKIEALLTTVTEGYDRISMHGIRVPLLTRQAESLGIPSEILRIPQGTSNEEYESALRETLTRRRESGIRSVAFGDIFLEDLRTYREGRLKEIGMRGVFPLWKRDTPDLARFFIREGFRAVITCVDTTHLGGEFAGREYDGHLLDELPEGVDPCGENGEFHTFVYDGPIFTERIGWHKGDVVEREERFVYCDLLPV
jgi:uncharacterized protein (TIGR00290 family)